MKDKLIVYWRKGCPYCEMATKLLDDHGFVYKLLKLDSDFSREDFYNSVPGATTFPQILINGVSIGGYEELLSEITQIK
jgi:glutaredoxin 3